MKTEEADPLDMEYWYPYLAPFTFKTEFIDLHRDEAQALADKYDDIKFGSEKSNPEILQQIAKKIENTIRVFGSGSAFVKLSTRSPKDVVIRDPRTKQRIIDEIQHLDPDLPEEQREVVSIIRTCSKAMKVNSGVEAVEMLSKSERAYQDLFVRLLTANAFSMKIVVREWVNIIPEYEFRGFIYKNSFNALTQISACYVPEIKKQQKNVEKMIKELFSQYQPIIEKSEPKIENYVADFAFDANFEHVYLVELNHWGTTASSSLFDWAKDNEVMHKGPFEFRVSINKFYSYAFSFLREPVKNVKLMMAAPLRQIMSEINPSWSVENLAKLQQATSESEENAPSKCCIQ